MTQANSRGACPRLAAPMWTGDGLLVRFAPSGTVRLDAFAAVCVSAGRHGNGILEITSRGSIQVRGMTDESAQAFAADVALLDRDIGDGVSITTDPLAGLDANEVLNANATAAALRLALADEHLVAALSPKISVIIDGGGALDLDGLAADVRLRAAMHGDQAFWHVSLGGTRSGSRRLGAVLPDDAEAAVTQLLGTIAARGPRARAHQLIRDDGMDRFSAAASDFLLDLPGPGVRPPGEPIGTHVLRDGHRALGIGLPFGHAHVDELQRLTDAAGHSGADGVRTAPSRVLLIVGLKASATGALRQSAEQLGFIVRPDDPRRHVAACAGAPICASGQIAARTLGPALAQAAAPLFDGSVTLHVSGCSKGCAHAGSAALTIVGSTHGCGIVVGGAARDRPVEYLEPDALPAGIARLADAVTRASRPGERSADVLRRLGASRIAQDIAAEAGRG